MWGLLKKALLDINNEVFDDVESVEGVPCFPMYGLPRPDNGVAARATTQNSDSALFPFLETRA